MDNEVKKQLLLLKNKGALTNGVPTAETFDNTTDSLENVRDELVVVDTVVDAIQVDVGNPSARTNFQSLETMLGLPDAANSNLDDIVRTGFDSSATTAAENGSVLERLEQLQEAVNVGTGTSLAADKSLVDALGTNGTTVADSAVSVLGAIGANNNDNAFDSTNVAANANGSVLERCEVIQVATSATAVGRTQIFEKAITSAANAGAVTAATVTSQPSMLKSITVRSNGATTADLTNITITGGASGVVTFINAADGVRANIAAADQQVAWTGAITLAATKTIVITLTGTGATAVDLTISFEYMATIAGGTLA